ncbi:hypothetical protein [Thermoleptolyngbya sp. PKUAC-SCTB121]|uniref:hypothetical protein n=1 Tax=Thermoleptolyngbya sp. PKUAC-SCTB121 TaxID=2811482 RepID=UPI001CEE00B0|nr:hypothetical protein [Thermoleptolyngbya sp. PKUAC-SCTB121]
MNEQDNGGDRPSHPDLASLEQALQPQKTLQRHLEAIAQQVQETAKASEGDGVALLRLLRLLEKLHQEIRDTMFQETLPKNRHSLYALLRDMEAEGGWPYISRMKLRSLLRHLLDEPPAESPNPLNPIADPEDFPRR